MASPRIPAAIVITLMACGIPFGVVILTHRTSSAPLILSRLFNAGAVNGATRPRSAIAATAARC